MPEHSAKHEGHMLTYIGLILLMFFFVYIEVLVFQWAYNNSFAKSIDGVKKINAWASFAWIVLLTSAGIFWRGASGRRDGRMAAYLNQWI